MSRERADRLRVDLNGVEDTGAAIEAGPGDTITGALVDARGQTLTSQVQMTFGASASKSPVWGPGGIAPGVARPDQTSPTPGLTIESVPFPGDNLVLSWISIKDATGRGLPDRTVVATLRAAPVGTQPSPNPVEADIAEIKASVARLEAKLDAALAR